jgi:hypothetical protein
MGASSDRLEALSLSISKFCTDEYKPLDEATLVEGGSNRIGDSSVFISSWGFELATPGNIIYKVYHKNISG